MQPVRTLILLRVQAMSWCERVLATHIECAKNFLREARTFDLAYEPGTYGSSDRCAGTRHAYVECINDPRRKNSTVKGILRQTGSGPPLCEQELNIHGKCIENWLRSAMDTKSDYLFLTHDGRHKCQATRDAFDKCIKGAR
eukprot:TRINITY_DN15740_c0_g1_i1.p1 TRINITY_DN15740_c0_g1~~TRINITY_DN15740_c0_g1_i1.p1  ORF type:complete len:141 (-),score=27.21 TRINITY_DN15740_c0_g1_i1:304-726(-)